MPMPGDFTRHRGIALRGVKLHHNRIAGPPIWASQVRLIEPDDPQRRRALAASEPVDRIFATNERIACAMATGCALFGLAPRRDASYLTGSACEVKPGLPPWGRTSVSAKCTHHNARHSRARSGWSRGWRRGAGRRDRRISGHRFRRDAARRTSAETDSEIVTSY